MASKRTKYKCLYNATLLLIDKLIYSEPFHISVDFILMLHGALYAYYKPAAGKFRTPVYSAKVTSNTFTPSHTGEIRTRLLDLTEFINKPRIKASRYKNNFARKIDGYSMLSPEVKRLWYALFCASYVHHQITYIHPFTGGNGRLARLLMCMELARHGLYKYTFPLLLNISILKHRTEYLDALAEADKGNIQYFCRFLAKMIKYSADNEKNLEKMMADNFK